MEHFYFTFDGVEYQQLHIHSWENMQTFKKLIDQQREQVFYFEHSYYNIVYMDDDYINKAIDYYQEHYTKDMDQIDDLPLYELGEFLND